MNISPISSCQIQRKENTSFKMFKSTSENSDFLMTLVNSCPKEMRQDLSFRPLMDYIKEKFGEKSKVIPIIQQFMKNMSLGNSHLLYITKKEEKAIPEGIEEFINYFANNGQPTNISTHDLYSQIISMRSQDSKEKEKAITEIYKQFIDSKTKKPQKWYLMETACLRGEDAYGKIQTPGLGNFMSNSQINVLKNNPNFDTALISLKTSTEIKEKHSKNMFEYLLKYVNKDGQKYTVLG